MKLLAISLIPAYFIIFTFTLSAQDTVRVPQDYTTIQFALDSVVANTIILVSPGTYYETLKWKSGIKGIQLIGEAGSDSTILDGNQAGRVIFKEIATSDPKSLIQGFTVRNGKSMDSDGGAGIYVFGSVNLRDLKVKNNKASGYAYGGGVHLTDYDGKIENCTFSNNEVRSTFQSLGGGMYMSSEGPVIIRNSHFSFNQNLGTTGSSGGGAYIQNSSGTDTIVIVNCNITGNTTVHNIHSKGAGLHISGAAFRIDSCTIYYNSTGGATNSHGGGMVSSSTNLLMRNSTIISNLAKKGHAIYFNSNNPTTSTFINCTIEYNADGYDEAALEVTTKSTTLNFLNCFIHRNAGMALRVSSAEAPKCKVSLTHCTLSDNYLGLDLKNTDLLVTNSILWNIQNELVFSGSHTEAVHSSLVKGGFPGGGNIDSDPLFLYPEDEILSNESPCLAAANPSFALPYDIFGNPRPRPLNTLPDIGAAELSQSLTYIHVKFYNDQNENGTRDPEDRFIRIGAAKIQQDKTYTNFRNAGFTVAVDPGPLTVTYDDALFNLWKITSSPIYTATVDSFAFAETIEFGMALKSNDVSILKPYITSDRLRCNQEVRLRITLNNENTFIDSDTLWVQLDERFENYTFETTPDIIVNNHLAGWYLNTLYPGESITYVGRVKVPRIGGTVHIGDLFNIRTWLNKDTDSTTFEYASELACSFDPNDKQVNPNRQDHEGLISSPLLYTIRFQNTGNDYAQHVSIVDTLDLSLDASTFGLVHTSHEDHLKVIFEDDHVVRFDFKNIFLPDITTNLNESNGHVSYTINAYPDVAPGTKIDNHADIYFDSNPSIVTNTTSTIMVTEISEEKHFLVPGRQWIYEHNTYEVLPVPLVGQTIETITVDGDTMINGLVYSKVIATLPPPCGIYDTIEFLREDGNKIFRLSADRTQEFLMIDFDESEDYQLMYDTEFGGIETGEAIIDSFGTEYTYEGIQVDVQYLRIHNNQSFDDDEPYKVYRDIGFVQYGILFPNVGTGLCDIMEGIKLRCFVNGQDTLHFTEFSCFESTLINSTYAPHISKIQLSPNPASDEINIPSGFQLIDIINVNGQRLYPTFNERSIDVTDLPSGYYMLRFVSEGHKEIYVGSIIKV